MRTLAAATIFAAMILPAQEPVPATARAAVNPKAERMRKIMGHGEGKLKPGDMAPDFKLRRIYSQKKIRLSAFRGRRPVALVFGSYT